jgi:MFS family permease
MKRCPKCGKQYDDSWERCLKDAAPLIGLSAKNAEIMDFLIPPKDPQEESLENMSTSIGKMIGAFSVVFVPLNFLAGIVGGIWLLFLGEWRLVVGGLFFSIAFPTCYALISLIGLPMIALISHLSDRGKNDLATFLGFINLTASNLFHLALVSFTVLFMLITPQGKTLFPFLIFGYAVILGPFQYMASHEPPDAVGSWLGLFFMQTAYVVMAITMALKAGLLGLLIMLILMFYLQTFLIKIAKYEIARKRF